jgi:hypothetical protein
MPQTYTVQKGDTANTIAQKYGFKNYKEANISGFKSGSPDLIQPGEVLNINKAPDIPASPAKVGNMNDASSFINAKQDEDIADATKMDEPPVRNSAQELADAFKGMTGKTSLVPTVAPTSPSFEDSFKTLRSQYGVDGLETTINDLDAQEADLQATRRQQTATEMDKPVAMNVISGRVSEEERAFNERLDVIQRQKARAVSQLQTANTAIENVMNFKKLDYDVAKANYDTEFSQNIQLFNTIKGVQDTATSEKEHDEDVARSNLQIIYNAFKDGDADPSLLDDSLKSKIGKMELQAGLPLGFYDTIKVQNPDGKILSTTTRTTGGTKYADIIYQNKDGSLKTSQVRLGATTEGDAAKPTEADLERDQRSKTLQYFKQSGIGGDGFTSPEAYMAARKAWIADVKGATPSEFDDIFAKDYLNPESYEKAGISY